VASLILTSHLGQKIQWKAHHKEICKLYNTYVSSNEFGALPCHEKMDALLLTHLLADISSSALSLSDDSSSAVTTFHSLLPSPQIVKSAPPIPHFKHALPVDTMRDIYSKFGNNNFTIHSHLNSIGHGVFPLASRLFNHSCSPNTAARYLFLHAAPVVMEVVALCDISPGEEVNFIVMMCSSVKRRY